MKKYLLILSVVGLVTGCCKKEKGTNGTMTVIKGCEGVYLRLNDLDYTICNEEKLASYESGAKVEATFVKENNCHSGAIHCMMMHGYPTAEGLYTITNVK